LQTRADKYRAPILSCPSSCQRLRLLMGRGHRLPSKPHPWCFGPVRHSEVRARIRPRSYSAKPPRIVIRSLPCTVAVSHQLSARDRKPAPAFATASRTLSKSLVERARQWRVTRERHPRQGPPVLCPRSSCVRASVSSLAQWAKQRPRPVIQDDPQAIRC
jgi:hypothetical protein